MVTITEESAVLLKHSSMPADPACMITPVNSPQTHDVHPAPEPPAPKPEPVAQTQKSGSLSQDQVTLKNAGQPDHDGNQ